MTNGRGNSQKLTPAYTRRGKSEKLGVEIKQKKEL